MPPVSPWKRPDEVMQLHRLKKRKKALQERMKNQTSNVNLKTSISLDCSSSLDFSKLLSDGEKRKNPFSKNTTEDANKKQKLEAEGIEESSDRTLFAILNLPQTHCDKPAAPTSDKLTNFSNLLQRYTTDHAVEFVPETKHKHMPIDWALKTKLRLTSPKPFAWDNKLKSSDEASGITGFTRCLDPTSHNLDTSHNAKFHQNCLFWQHPHLPWINLFPRSTGKVSATSFLATNEMAKAALYKEWANSFRSLFQLLRARHCPYFYLCANTFTCLFRAAGICGVSEPCVLISPTTRGFRQTLKQEDVEFTMPLRPSSKRKLNTSDSQDQDKPKNSSYDSCYDTMDDIQSPQDHQMDRKNSIDNHEKKHSQMDSCIDKKSSQDNQMDDNQNDSIYSQYSRKDKLFSQDSLKDNSQNDGSSQNSQSDKKYSQDSLKDKTLSQNSQKDGRCSQDGLKNDCKKDKQIDDEEGSDDDVDDNFLSQLGFQEEQIKKFNSSQIRIQHAIESKVDLAEESLVFVRGVEAQALFNFLLNCKSIVSGTGPFAGIPPTLLSPTAFHGGTLQALNVRDSVIYSDNTKHYSIELRGPILPTTVHSLFNLVQGGSAKVNATFANVPAMRAFSTAARGIADDESTKENEPNRISSAFNKENLSDCGMSKQMLSYFCSSDPDLVNTVDSVKYCAEDDSFIW